MNLPIQMLVASLEYIVKYKKHEKLHHLISNIFSDFAI